MKPELIEYSGYLTYQPLSSQQVEEIRRIGASFGEELDAQPDWLEFEYSGRDAGRKIVLLLRQLAPIIGNAEGEIVCQLDTHSTTPGFEFYSIRGGKLLKQAGHIVRGPIEEVAGEPASASHARP